MPPSRPIVNLDSDDEVPDCEELFARSTSHSKEFLSNSIEALDEKLEELSKACHVCDVEVDALEKLLKNAKERRAGFVMSYWKGVDQQKEMRKELTLTSSRKKNKKPVLQPAVGSASAGTAKKANKNQKPVVLIIESPRPETAKKGGNKISKILKLDDEHKSHDSPSPASKAMPPSPPRRVLRTRPARSMPNPSVVQARSTRSSMLLPPTPQAAKRHMVSESPAKRVKYEQAPPEEQTCIRQRIFDAIEGDDAVGADDAQQAAEPSSRPTRGVEIRRSYGGKFGSGTSLSRAAFNARRGAKNE